MTTPPDSPRLTRRQVLIGAGAVGVVGAATAAGATRPWNLLSSPAAATLPAGQGRLVVVSLYGGNDGLNTVIPFTDPAYHAARPDLGYQPHEVLPITPELALSPKLPGLKALWDAHQLAVVQGVGYDNPSLSHFQSMDIWQTASADGSGPGWLGRWLDATGRDPMRALSLGPTLPTLLRGDASAATAITSSTITLPGGARYQSGYAHLVGPGPDRTGLAAQVAQTGADLLAVKGQLDRYHPGGPAAGAARAATLTDQLGVVSSLILAGAPTRVYQVSISSFDTHSDERSGQERLLAELDAGVTAFFKGLAGHPAGRDVVLMTYSEFGRRVQQNASGGTDHGTAAPLFVAGQAVKGGRLYGEAPSLTRLDPTGNLLHSVDFRSVYATMLAGVIGVDPKRLLGAGYPTLDLL
jgi:uncharacterized protein (DUF1501 family)